jgi:O-antigen ligase
VIRRALAVLPCAVLLVALVAPDTPLLARAFLVAIFGITLWSPASGLLATAGVAPLGAYIAALDGLVNFRLSEVILLSFLAGWLLRSDFGPRTDRGPRTDQAPGTPHQGPTLPRYARIAAWFFTVLLASLAFALCRQVFREHPDALRTDLTTLALRYFNFSDPTGISDAVRMIEGFAVVAAVMDVFRRKPGLARSLPVALASSALAAASTSLLLWAGIAPQRVLARAALIGYRFSAHVLDPNAAGSFFVLVLCLALGVALRESGRRRIFFAIAAVACAFGLWMTRSRTAEAAAGLVIPATFLWAATTEWSRAKRVRLIGGVLAVLVVFGAIRAVQIERDPTYTASGFRQQFVMSSFRVIGTHPYLGIGPGRYFRDSPNFLTPQLAWSYGSENAHNNFLEITTEAGIIGFFVYAAWFVGAIRPAFAALARDPRDWRLLGCTAGIVGFLGTCLLGHPLLVPEVATPFFFQLGLAASLGGSALLNSFGRSGHLQVVARPPEGGRHLPWRAITVVGTIVFAVLPAWTLEKPLVPVHLEEVDGMYYADGGIAEDVPFTWTRQYASLFVPAQARVIEIPLRAPSSAVLGDQVVVDIMVNGTMIKRAIVDSHWSSVVIGLPTPDPPLQKNRVNLYVNHVARVSDFTAGSDDHRVVGVQVGTIGILQVAWEYVPKLNGFRDSP